MTDDVGSVLPMEIGEQNGFSRTFGEEQEKPHTFGTMLSVAGVKPRTAQEVMRHSTLDLTMNIYTDPALLDTAGAVEALPNLPVDRGKTATRRNGHL